MEPCSHRVQYYETDMMGVTHHANYIHWMEEARIDFMDQLGFPYAAMEARGILSPVREVSCRYLRPTTFGDRVEVRVSVTAFDGVTLTLGYELRKAGEDEPVCTASSRHVFLDRQGHFVRLKRELPEFFGVLRSLAEASPGA